MIGKRRLIAFAMLVALTVFGVLNLDTMRLSARESPAIYISPAYVQEDPGSAIGTNYTFSIMTDYDGSDVWGYEFALTYNPNVLEGKEVVNGDLITGGLAMWSPGPFNNTSGELEMTGNGFYYDDPPPPTTSGPGILANVTFTAVGYGISNIAFVENKTRLIGYDPEHPRARPEGDYDIINEYFPYMGHIEGSVFDISIPGDVDGSGKVNYEDLFALADAYGSHGPDYNYPGEPASPTWDPRCDFNHNNRIDYEDLFTLADHYGMHYP
jgi:hypothetical protein